MVKLIFTDMDDTFLDAKKRISPLNARMLDLAAEKGVGVVPCTGRNLNGVPRELVEHPAVRYAVCCNGALVVDVRTGTVLHEVDLNKPQVLEVYGRLRDLDITVDLFADSTIYTERSRASVIDRTPLDEPMREFVKSVRTFYDEPFERQLEAVGEVCRLNVFFLSEANRRAVYDVVDACPNLRRSSSLPCNVEITDAGAHKGAGLAWLCDYLGVDVADTVAFGDGDNDLTMIEAAGDGVAMANAIPELRAVANHVCGGCDESGVGEYLQGLLR